MNISIEENLKNDLESLLDIFNCVICMERLVDPRLCPECSKFCCLKCIDLWMNKGNRSCPHCRKQINEGKMINCRWAEDYIRRLSLIKKKKEVNSQIDNCKKHPSQKLTVYCRNCTKCICKECALWNRKHPLKKLQPLDEVCLEIAKELKKNEDSLDEIKDRMIIVLSQVNNNTEALKEKRTEVYYEVEQLLKAIRSDSEEALEDLIKGLLEKKGNILTDLNKLKLLSEDLLSCKNSKSKQLIIKLSSEVKKKVSSFINSTLFYKNDHQEQVSNFTNDVLTDFTVFSYEVEDFTKLCQENKTSNSPQWPFGTSLWTLQIFQYGTEDKKNLFAKLKLISGSLNITKLGYKIEIVHPTENKVLKYSNQLILGLNWSSITLYKVSSLISEGFVEKDKLRLKLHLKWPSYKDKADHFESHFNKNTTTEMIKLKEDNAKMNEENKELKDDYDKIKSKYNNSKKKNQEIFNENNKIKDENDELKKSRDKLDDQIKSLKNEIKSLESKNKTTEEKKEKLEEINTKIEEENKKLEKSFRKIEDEIKKINENYNKLEGENSKVQENYNKKSQEFSCLEKNYIKVKDEYKKLEESYDELKQKHSNFKDEFKNLDEKNKKIQQENNKMKEENVKTVKENSIFKTNLSTTTPLQKS